MPRIAGAGEPAAPDPTTPLLGRAWPDPEGPTYEAFGPCRDVEGSQGEPEHLPEKWNDPPINVARILAAFLSFIVVGANDGIYGALVHYLGEYYEVNYAHVSAVFLSPCVGYATAALVSNWIHVHFGRRGIALLGPAFHVIAYGTSSLHPSFGVLVFVFVLAGLGSGLLDAGWNAWIGSMQDSSKPMGILHGFYGLGAALAPLIATSLITKSGWTWYEVYCIMAAAAVIELVGLTAVFWSARGFTHGTPPNHDTGDKDHSGYFKLDSLRNSPTIQSLQSSFTWIISLFIFLYAGVEISFGGWIFTFLVNRRNATTYTAGMVVGLYWAGLTIGRVILGFVTSRQKSGKAMVTIYLLACLASHGLFCLVTDLAVSVSAVVSLGFFLGPLFPEAVIELARLLPKHLHVAGVGIACTLGSAGGCVFPFVMGSLAEIVGIQVLQPMAFGMLVLCLVIWLVLPGRAR
ncbi:hypothetical protein ETB97_004608 [Aspergillus alliaceus]|uniref:Uncharacterized protein n=1 Tax=Petromyces alliaceus TaxID=209559 RepID=A0A5N6G1A5_PETAA|nr:MFS transporter [Aspergillus alliaceus]KAB8235295.1 MFS transporter [Aspergillus alliaceus]KAF5858289.1 hypothetical protein ETB97_004608 [Aspergillus burnettii]